ncbi:hypothetical protein [Paracoccus pantotrophus]|uniref:hypothetical protein n=1 Tax=Paracoccus pantotrophus TaxID=82367 RepID=UPI0012DD815A|nr:hypothetical protein [Paracoccus pantotrophus]
MTFWLRTGFDGDVALKVVGPKVLVNQAYYDNRAYFRNNYLTENWSGSGAIFAQFPPSTRSVVSKLDVPLPTDTIPGHIWGGDDTFAKNPKYPLWALGWGSIKVECS